MYLVEYDSYSGWKMNDLRKTIEDHETQRKKYPENKHYFGFLTGIIDESREQLERMEAVEKMENTVYPLGVQVDEETYFEIAKWVNENNSI